MPTTYKIHTTYILHNHKILVRTKRIQKVINKPICKLIHKVIAFIYEGENSLNNRVIQLSV